MSRTQARPTGLLDILGMQSAGDVPQEVMDELVLTVDMSELYLIARAFTEYTNTTGYSSAAVAWDTITSSLFQVPSGVMRKLLNYSAYVYGLTTQGVDIGQLWIGLPVGGGVFQQCGVQQTSDALPASRLGVGSAVSLAKPVFIPPDGIFGCNARVYAPVAATTYNVSHVARWVDLRI